MLKLLVIICLLSTSCLAESPAELLNSTSNLSPREAADLLIAHGYDISYVGGVFWLNDTVKIEEMFT